MDVTKYLQRIGFDGQPKADLDTLQALQKCHQLTVPFDNLDGVLQIPAKLNLPDLYDKIVVRNRGGWCHEQNGLFCWLLKEIGFEVLMVNSQPLNSNFADGWGPLFDHMALIVSIPGENNDEYLVDVGWGMFIAHFLPIRLDDGVVAPQPNGDYRVVKMASPWWRLEQRFLDAPQWQTIHKFEVRSRQLQEFQARSLELLDGHFLSSLPSVIIKSSPTSGHLLIGTKLRSYEDIGLSEARRTVAKDDDLDAGRMEDILRNVFKIDLKLNGIDTAKWKITYKKDLTPVTAAQDKNSAEYHEKKLQEMAFLAAF